MQYVLPQRRESAHLGFGGYENNGVSEVKSREQLRERPLDL